MKAPPRSDILDKDPVCICCVEKTFHILRSFVPAEHIDEPSLSLVFDGKKIFVKRLERGHHGIFLIRKPMVIHIADRISVFVVLGTKHQINRKQFITKDELLSLFVPIYPVGLIAECKRVLAMERSGF